MSDTLPVLRGRRTPLALASPHEIGPPPPELQPDSFAERLYVSLAPVAKLDPDVGWSLLIFCNAIGTMFQLLDDWERDTVDGEGWSLLLDLNRCPDEALPWLAQLVGVRLLPDTTPAEQRERIASTDGFKRGTAAAIRGAALGTLTGSKRLVFRERDHDPADTPDYAYYLTAHTLVDETPDPAATLAAMLAQKPGGIVLTYSTVTGQDYISLSEHNASYSALQAKYTDYLAASADLPV